MLTASLGILLGLLLALPLFTCRKAGRPLVFAAAIGGVLLSGLCPHPEIQRQAAGVVLLMLGLALVRVCRRPATLAAGVTLIGAGSALAGGGGQ